MLFAPIIAIAAAEASATYDSRGGLSRQRLEPDLILVAACFDPLKQFLGFFEIAAGKQEAIFPGLAIPDRRAAGFGCDDLELAQVLGKAYPSHLVSAR
ncbi:hypothetical protein [Pseudomonas sp. ML96]|uniref:hypothetical protein n=1 Tax=Pseudomonas sp. ML96 TaxID=1523503 RepID=UPI0012E00869|nr:hypothetical protein [Pseudomonas sp. ML96]